jgi:hypothetical protein
MGRCGGSNSPSDNQIPEEGAVSMLLMGVFSKAAEMIFHK